QGRQLVQRTRGLGHGDGRQQQTETHTKSAHVTHQKLLTLTVGCVHTHTSTLVVEATLLAGTFTDASTFSTQATPAPWARPWTSTAATSPLPLMLSTARTRSRAGSWQAFSSAL